MDYELLKMLEDENISFTVIGLMCSIYNEDTSAHEILIELDHELQIVKLEISPNDINLKMVHSGTLYEQKPSKVVPSRVLRKMQHWEMRHKVGFTN